MRGTNYAKLTPEERRKIIEKVDKIIDEEVRKSAAFQRIRKTIRLLIRRKLELGKKNNTLIIYGPFGMGKSTAIEKILNELRENFRFKYIKINAQRFEYATKEALKEIKDIIKSNDVIVFDDCFISKRFQEILLYTIKEANKVVIIIVNSLKELENIHKIIGQGKTKLYTLTYEELNRIRRRIEKELGIYLEPPIMNLRDIDYRVSSIILGEEYIESSLEELIGDMGSKREVIEKIAEILATMDIKETILDNVIRVIVKQLALDKDEYKELKKGLENRVKLLRESIVKIVN